VTVPVVDSSEIDVALTAVIDPVTDARRLARGSQGTRKVLSA
jgi:hypothetical protein